MISGACPGCRRPLKAGAAEGLCAACLLGNALLLASAAGDTSDAEADLIAASGLEGRTLGDYEILSTLAQGGMGVVFKARQRNPRRIVALKVISAGELATRKMVERFHNEALAAARLSHPNIVPIHEVGEDRGWHYFSMRLVEGGTLADLIRERRPEPRAAVALLLKLARAVEHAHQRGILHRDLKPTNILLDQQGEPHLTDFGLAKVTEQDSDLTLSHAVLGTPAYMSPEQASGNSRDITTATDVYGLGAIFYELLSGRPPFTAESTPALLRKIAEEEPGRITNHEFRMTGVGGSGPGHVDRKSKIANAVPPDLSVICLKCLEKSPARRYATAGELADELERWLRHEPIHARPATAWERNVKWVRRHRALSALFATVILAGFVVTVISLLFNIRLDSARNLAEQNAARRHDQLVREHLREAGRATAAGDGLTGLFALTEALRLERDNRTSAGAIRRRLGLTLRSSPELLRLWDAGGSPYRMQFSDDNRRLSAAMHDGSLRVWNLPEGTGADLRPGEGEHSFGIVFSPDGHQAAESLAAPPFVRIRLLDRGTAVTLPVKTVCQGAVAFSGGGRWLITGGERLRVWDTTTYGEVPLKDRADGPWARLGGSPDDRFIVAITPGGSGRLLDTATWTWRETEEPISSPGGQLPSFSEDGRWLLTFSPEQVLLWETASGTRKFSAPHSGLLFTPAFSPDNRFFAVPTFRDQARVWSLPSAATGTNVTAFRLPIRHETGANQTVFSPDGRLLATAGFDYQLRLLNTSRHQLVAPLLHHTALIEAVAFSADGRFLASADARGLVRVWNLQPRGVTTLPGVAAVPAPLFTADGNQVVARDFEDRLRLWNVASGTAADEPLYEATEAAPNRVEPPSASPVASHGAPMDLAWDASRKYLAAAVGSQGVRVWEFPSRLLVGVWTNVGTVLSVAFEPRSTALAAGNSAGEILCLDVGAGRPAETFHGALIPARTLVWSADGRWLAAGGERAVQVWDFRGKAPLTDPLQIPDVLKVVRFSPDGRHLLTAAGNDAIAPGAARLWELPSLNPVPASLEHGDGVAAAAFSPDGQWVASGGEDNVVRLWRAATGAAVGRALRHEGIITALDFDPTSRWLAASGYDSQLRLWSVPDGDLGGPALPLAPPVATVVFSPGGERVFAGSQRENSWLVSFAPALESPEDIERLARAQTTLRSTPDGALEQAPPADLAREFAARLPSGDVFVSPAEAAAWHEGIALPAEAAGAWFTAEFHLRRLMALRPDDPALRRRWERAQAAQARALR